MPVTKLKPRVAAPKHLQAPGRDLWLSTVADWDLLDSELVTLSTACETADRLTEIREAISRDGVVITDPSGRVRSHPLLAAESQCHGVLLRAWGMLDLTERELPKIGRPSTRA